MLGAQELSEFTYFFLRVLDTMFFGGENVALLVLRHGFFAALNEALQGDGEQLLERRLDGALDCQALGVHHLEAALHDQRGELFGELDRMRVQERQKHLQNPDLSHFIENF